MKFIFESLETVEIELNEDNCNLKVSDFKSKICTERDISKNIYLVFGGKNLENNKMMSHYEIEDKSCIQVFTEVTEFNEEVQESNSENLNTQEETREPESERRNPNNDNINIMYEFTLGGQNTPLSMNSNRVNLNSRESLSDIFNLFTNISNPPRGDRNQSNIFSNRNPNNNRHNNNVQIPNHQRGASIDNTNNNNQFNRDNRVPNNPTEVRSHNSNLQNQSGINELWQLLYGVSGRSNLRPILRILNNHGLNIPITEAQNFIDTMSTNDAHRLNMLSSLINLFNHIRVPEHRDSLRVRENETPDYSQKVVQVKEMGFFDEEMILETLKNCNGNINLTVETLLNKINTAG